MQRRSPDAAQHHKRVHARLRRARVMRCRSGGHRSRGKSVGPGSAKQRHALHRARDTGLAEGAEAVAEEIESAWRPDFGFASGKRLRCIR